ncbi:MAG: PEP/pyruvate-binding domain-containing protein [Acidimicrobiia bacterium]
MDRATPAAVVWLSDDRARAADLAGAKAAALAVAGSAGLPVLPGFVLTTGYEPGDPAHEDELRHAWAKLSHGGELAVVVRSSSTIEDSESTSMAGMFTSVLDVSGWDRLLEAVETVLASRNVVPLVDGGSEAPMAVLVQPFLPAASGGVMFGLDPVSGRSDRLVVSATERGPAALVGGEVDGSRYVLSRHGRLVDAPGGAAVLNRRQRHELARMARAAERVFGGPQDVEWAFDAEGTLRMLQSRPVTARGEEATSGPVFGPGPVAETFPEALTPLEQDLWADPLRDALRHALALAGTAPARRLAQSPVLTAVGGRLAVDLAVLPDGSAGRSVASRLDPRPSMRKLAAAWRVGRLRAALPLLATDLVAQADDELLAVDAVTGMTDLQLLSVLDSARQALTALHGHEVLMGWLVDAESSSVTAASVGMRLLADGRSQGLSDEEIVARDPGVLALVPPRIGGSAQLPPTPDRLPAAGHGAGAPADDDPALLREALRLRARWVQELTARGAWELGRRLAAAGVLADARQVAWLGLEDLRSAVRTHTAPADLDERRPVLSAPLPARFRMTTSGAVVAVVDRRRRGGARSGATGAGGGRGVGLVHDGEGVPAHGAVLVVRTLDPGLASVLPRLGGLVAETGSPLSHLAILAREVGVPTVVGVADAMARFPAGALVLVDGTTGEVSRIDKERGAA